MSRNKWTNEEIQYVKDNYLKLSDKEISENLKTHSEKSVVTKRKRIGCTRTNRKYSFNDVIKEFEKTNYILLSEPSDYIDSAANTLRYLCPKHLDKGEMTISLGHLQSGRGCYYCGREITENAHVLDNKINEQDCKNICNKKNFIYISNYRENGMIVINYICPKHPEAGIQNMRKSNMNRDNIIGCPYCFDTKLFKFSKGEKKIESILDNLKITYLPQYTFKDCRDINMLPFDYYLPDINKIIEYDGQHHYFPVNFNGISDEEAKERFIKTVYHDEIKDNYCKNNKIDILRIPYYDFKNIEVIIRNFLNISDVA